MTCKIQSLLLEKSETEPRAGSGFNTIDEDRSRSSVEKLLLPLLSCDAEEERNGFGSEREQLTRR